MLENRHPPLNCAMVTSSRGFFLLGILLRVLFCELFRAPVFPGCFSMGYHSTVGLSFLGLKVSRASFGPWGNLKARFKAEMFGAVFCAVSFRIFEWSASDCGLN